MNDTNKHNAWTLTKHVAGSINRKAGQLDVAIYGPKTNIAFKTYTVQEPVKPVSKFKTGLQAVGAIVGGVLFLVVMIAFFTSNWGAEYRRDNKLWWL